MNEAYELAAECIARINRGTAALNADYVRAHVDLLSDLIGQAEAEALINHFSPPVATPWMTVGSGE